MLRRELQFALALLCPFVSPDRGATRRGTGSPDLEASDANIDAHILPLVNALNTTGFVRTRASCEGHWLDRYYISDPYVAFTGDTAYIELLDRLLCEAKLSGRVYFYWDMHAIFGTDRLLWFRLAASTEHLGQGRVMPWRGGGNFEFNSMLTSLSSLR
jgi:hypothetical protein